MSIVIFSRPIHSGKTTALLQWSRGKTGICGIAMPDIDGSRKLLDLSSQQLFDMQCINPENSTEALISIGKYHFYASAFGKGNAILFDALEKDPDWLIIDEVGKLELDEKGFYPAVQKAVRLYQQTSRQGHLLLTVREGLTDAVMGFFGIHTCKLVTGMEELSSLA